MIAHNKSLQLTFDPPFSFSAAKAGIASNAPERGRSAPPELRAFLRERTATCLCREIASQRSKLRAWAELDPGIRKQAGAAMSAQCFWVGFFEHQHRKRPSLEACGADGFDVQPEIKATGSQVKPGMTQERGQPQKAPYPFNRNTPYNSEIPSATMSCPCSSGVYSTTGSVRSAKRQGSKHISRSSCSKSGNLIGLSSVYHCQYCSGGDFSPARSM